MKVAREDQARKENKKPEEIKVDLSAVNFEKSQQSLQEAVKLNKDMWRAHYYLGRIYRENRNDPIRARNVWELALKDWREKQAAHKDPDSLVYEQILGQLAKLEEEQKNYLQAIAYLQDLKVVSPSWPSVEKWIEELKVKSK